MVANMKKVGEGRFREDYGRYYEDFEVGHIISSKGTFKTGKFVNCEECREKKQQ